jgi:hypothetical protein
LADVEMTGQSSEARRAPRERALLTARISYNNGALSTQCSVVQISASGAKINVAAGACLPDVFQFAIPQRSIDCRAKLVWRRGDLAGVAFERDAVAAQADPDDANRALIKALRTENEKLKGRIGVLKAQIARLNNE